MKNRQLTDFCTLSHQKYKKTIDLRFLVSRMRASLGELQTVQQVDSVKPANSFANFLKKMLDTANKQRIIRIPLKEVAKTL